MSGSTGISQKDYPLAHYYLGLIEANRLRENSDPAFGLVFFGKVITDDPLEVTTKSDGKILLSVLAKRAYVEWALKIEKDLGEFQYKQAIQYALDLCETNVNSIFSRCLARKEDNRTTTKYFNFMI